MKSVLFCCYGLGIGGIEKCLVNLINVMPEDEFDIDLLLLNPEHAFVPAIKRNVTILDSFSYVMNTTDTFGEIAARGGCIRNLPTALRYILFRFFVKLNRRPWRVFRSIGKKYDIAIAYSQNDYSPYYVIDKVNAGRKVLWYHNGAYEKKGRAYDRDRSYYLKFDYVVAVSKDCRKMLREKFKFADEQLVVLTNFYDVNDIREKANELPHPTFKKDCINIVTVGRLTAEKGADFAISACKQLLSLGRRICWYWVGDGNQRSTIEEQIGLYNLQDSFILVGSKANPYPYILSADIYVQPSYYEAYSTTVFEAKALEKVIIATDVGGMREQIDTMKNGLIVPLDAASISEAICTLSDDALLREHIKRNLREEIFDPNANLKEYKETVFQ